MRIETINNITRLTADEGKVLVSGDSIGTEAWLAPSDSIENWKEFDKDYKADEVETVITQLEELT